MGPAAAKRPPDKLHPFGYGRELYFWSFVVAVLVFSLGAGVSVYEGYLHILHPEPAVDPLIAYIVLLVAFLLEGWSTVEAFGDFKKAKGDLSWFQAVRQSKRSSLLTTPVAWMVFFRPLARSMISARQVGSYSTP